jgi:hypothetical protein
MQICVVTRVGPGTFCLQFIVVYADMHCIVFFLDRIETLEYY